MENAKREQKKKKNRVVFVLYEHLRDSGFFYVLRLTGAGVGCEQCLFR